MGSDPVPAQPGILDHHHEDSDSSSDSESQNPFDREDINLDRSFYPPNGVTFGEVLLSMMDLVAAHKLTNAAASDVWNLLGSVVPEGTDVGTFSLAEIILRAHMKDALVVNHRQRHTHTHAHTRPQVVPVCINDCVAFYDFQSPALQSMQNSQLDECPRCQASRYVVCPIKRTRKDAKVMYYLPSYHYWQYLFGQPEVVMNLFNDRSCVLYPPGSVRSSGGYYRKVTSNPNINSDGRHQAVILSTDGMPYFKDKGCRSGWPVLMRSAMLPDGLWNSNAYTHMIAFQPSEYFVNDETGSIVRVQR